ncbi:hypothetical protein ACEWFX_01285 [Bifidobacterium longum subsp. suis]|jgi:hypothetical protein|uniref:hypothetical protein n=1 Tax=Bifidobacterium longum TaxID=216816 RepID=UPI003D066059
MMRDTILCLCDLTGVMARPWVEHGYQAVLVDPQHGCDHEDGAYLKLACTIEEGRAAYQAWLKEHDRQIAEKAWEEGYIQAVKNMNPMPGEESPEYTPNPYRKENA